MQDQILAELSKIDDPDLNQDIVSLGFIKNLNIDGSKVSFDLELTTPACPVKDDLKRQCVERVSSIDGIETVEVELKAQARKSPNDDAAQEMLKDIGHIVAVSSCKGGVGKSTVASNLAFAIAKAGAKVGILDADIFGPSQPTLLGVENLQPQVEDQRFIPIDVDGVKMMSAGYLFPPTEAAVLRGPMVTNVLQQMLLFTKWGELDYLIIDMPPGTGDVQLTISQVLPLTGALIVSTPQKLSLLDVGKGIAMFDKVNVPVLGVVENMSHLMCHKCGEKTELYGPSGIPHLLDQYGIELLGQIPFMRDIVLMSDRGTPPSRQPESAEGRAYHELAEVTVRKVAQHVHDQAQAPHVDIDW